ncbi:MAG: RsmD family RNA methyltransferase [bacterium]
MKRKSCLSVIAGIYKGRKLLCPENVRPLTGLCKKSLFDILEGRLAGAGFLDLFSGTGSVGIEALSRGAAFTAFVEQAGGVVEILRENLERMNVPQDKYRILQMDAVVFPSQDTEKYDIIFIGPPYKFTLPVDFIDKTFEILSTGGIVICQHSSKVKTSFVRAPFRTKKFGITTLDFYEQGK